MITHLVLFRFKPGFAAESPAVKAVHAAMEALPGQVTGIREWRHGFNVTPDAEAWDYGLFASFDDEQALFSYFEHPAHLAVLARWNEVAELRFVDLAPPKS
ncbi:Dabb family protein [Uliginosibacterium sp. H1]|uniref:Dabb family protein n=1 Tax=Uliginosibacterium sp. H1 TaxID=3114757 RepID=UPI002E198084|nr:Dabb family protein [Uliginosibacterium sp. H1]